MDISSNDRSAMMPNYSFPDLVPEKASGSRLWDENGKEYIDFGGGIAVTSLGHCHPVLMKSMEEQSKKLWHVSNYLLSKPAKELGQKIASKSFADKVLFSNSGNEANEAAIKLARKYFFEKGDEEKYEILSFTNSFHGRSLANITLGDSEFHQTGFGPLPKGFIKAEFLLSNENGLEVYVDESGLSILFEELNKFIKFYKLEMEISSKEVFYKFSQNNDNFEYIFSNNGLFCDIDLKANNDEKFLTVEQFELNILLMGQFSFDYRDINKYRPHDVGMNKSHVSFSKGCFRGQEVIARTEHLSKKKKEILPIKSDDEANIDSKKIVTLKEISFEKDIFKLVSFIPN